MTEREALSRVQDVASRYSEDETALDIAAVATLTLANRIHMQLLKGELEDLQARLDRVERQVWAGAGEG